jgi:hypothetical protein
MLLTLIVAFVTVVSCCVAAQCLVQWSRTSKSLLNQARTKQKFARAKMIQKYLAEEDAQRHSHDGEDNDDDEDMRKQI